MSFDVTQPISVIIAAFIASATGVITLIVTLIQNSSFKRNENKISKINSKINEVNSNIYIKLADLK